MRKLSSYIIILALVTIGIYVYIEKQFVQNPLDPLVQNEKSELPKIKSRQETKEIKELIEGDLFSLIEKSDKEVKEKLGEPLRKDPTPYGYTWWIYSDSSTYQIQIGIEAGQVQTIFATGENIETDPFVIGATYDAIKKQFPFKEKVTYQTGLSFYSFLLNENDITTTPLISLSDHVFVQCYFDTFTETLSAIRIVTGDVLLKQRMYEMEYRGALPDELTLSKEEWKKVESGMEQQVFELSNVYRNRFDQSALIYDEQVSEVAFLHSKDMDQNHYFSHYSQDGKGLKERLEEKEVYYLSAGENIAAQHTDGPAAVEGWLNSEGHREALLHDEYTHLGVGVSHLYYTQNFLLKP